MSRVLVFFALVSSVAGHGALYIPTPRNAMDRALPEFEGGKSPKEACTCNNGNGGKSATSTGCDGESSLPSSAPPAAGSKARARRRCLSPRLR